MNYALRVGEKGTQHLKGHHLTCIWCTETRVHLGLEEPMIYPYRESSSKRAEHTLLSVGPRTYIQTTGAGNIKLQSNQLELIPQNNE